MPTRKRAWGTLGFIAALLFLALFALATVVHSYDLTTEVSLPLLAIAGVVVLLGALALVSIAFKMMDMANPQEALALPAGSVRAVIALSLVVLFAILAVFLFSGLGNGGTVQKLTCLTLLEKDAFEHNRGSQVLFSVESAVSETGAPCPVRGPGTSETTKGGEGTNPGAPAPVSAPSGTTPAVPLGTSGSGAASNATVQPSAPSGNTSPTQPSGAAQGAATPSTPTPETKRPAGATSFTVRYRDARDPASNDFAKQLLVLIGTLVTAVSSFYFGARAASDARATPDLPPSLVGVDPTTAEVGKELNLRITGKNLNSVGHAHLAYGSNEIHDKGVTSNPTEVRAHFQIREEDVPADARDKRWDVVVTDANNRTDRLRAAIQVITKPSGG